MTTTNLRACPTCGIRRIVDPRRNPNAPCIDCSPSRALTPTRATYVAQWPILDDTRTLTELAEEAIDSLADLIDRERHVMLASPTWSLTENVDGVPMLRAEVPVRPVEYRVRPRRDDAA